MIVAVKADDNKIAIKYNNKIGNKDGYNWTAPSVKQTKALLYAAVNFEISLWYNTLVRSAFTPVREVLSPEPSSTNEGLNSTVFASAQRSLTLEEIYSYAGLTPK